MGDKIAAADRDGMLIVLSTFRRLIWAGVVEEETKPTSDTKIPALSARIFCMSSCVLCVRYFKGASRSFTCPFSDLRNVKPSCREKQTAGPPSSSDASYQ